jgi:hypothetical protein
MGVSGPWEVAFSLWDIRLVEAAPAVNEPPGIGRGVLQSGLKAGGDWMGRGLWGILALILIIAGPAAAETRLFTDDAPLHLTLTGPFSKLAAGAKYSISPYPATLALTDENRGGQAFPIQMRARGISRREEYCNFPPIELMFDKTVMHGTLFQGQKKLKLVTYCKSPPDYEQRIILEYLVYRLYNLITPASLRVRAAEVTYRETATDPGVTRFGYVIEDIHQLADRNQGDELTAASHQVSIPQLDAHATTRAAMLEFMIANLDWEFLASAPGQTCCHNIRLLSAQGVTPERASAVKPVPYDFDFSGFVDAPYAGPPPNFPTESVTDRYFRGFCVMAAEAPSVAQEYLARRGEMKALIDNQAQLTQKFRDKADHFMDGFFAIISDPALLQSQVTKHCR